MSNIDQSDSNSPDQAGTANRLASGTTVRQFGPYEIYEQVGSGATGNVYRGLHKGLQREVAIKVLTKELAQSDEKRKAFLEEARCMAQLEHPALVPVYDVGQLKDYVYMAMKLMVGDMRQYVLDHGRLPWADGLAMLRDLAEGLHEVHELGLLHRDITPKNLFYDANDKVRIGDFGFFYDPTNDDGYSDSSYGTPAYIPPESVKRQHIDMRADIYGLGASMFFLMTERRPYEGSSVQVQLRKVVNSPVPRLTEFNPEIPAGVSDLIFRMMSKDPNERPSSAQDVMQECERLLQSEAGARGAKSLVASVEDESAKLAFPEEQETKKVDTLRATTIETATVAPTVINSLGMAFVPISAGRFMMGSSVTEAERSEDEGPQHPVVLTKDYLLGIFPVTWQQYNQLGMKAELLNRYAPAPNAPVEGISWEDAVAFCRKLSQLPAEQEAGRTYRLPSEAEWEYACRAGTTTAFWWGETLSGQQAYFNALHPYGETTLGEAPAAPASFDTARPANPWGLYEMHGNVWEWCSDGHGPYAPSEEVDPQGCPPRKLKRRILRGGDILSPGKACRAASRNSLPVRSHRGHSYTTVDKSQNVVVGFRIVCEQA